MSPVAVLLPATFLRPGTVPAVEPLFTRVTVLFVMSVTVVTMLTMTVVTPFPSTGPPLGIRTSEVRSVFAAGT